MSSFSPAPDPFGQIEAIIARDPGHRGIAPLLLPGSVAAAAHSLVDAEHVLLITGFFIERAGACETDGLGGTAALRHALSALDVPTIIVSDRFCEPVMRAAGFDDMVLYPDAFPLVRAPSHGVAIERVGRHQDGTYRSMRGTDITAMTGPVDELFLDPGDSITIGIGDGGNEMGMGKVRERVIDSIPRGPQIATIVPAHHLLVAGTGDWGAWGLVAGLSLVVGRSLLPSVEQARGWLDRFVAAGAVDPFSLVAEARVDGLSWEVGAALLRDLHRVVDAELGA
ncbi:hypothetical protein Pan216_58110 [Planctomycetes bacterium Pan216]|uniref:D-glutamate cyclase-like C-terminal domain-containing protein n=1 Tax=Kolteria novifilia TaxID=2527975 RepID=A0A518BD67_9BACT|nr:hypothetical protein Pan216_58110 [Planctomycetes bacterium Pan216]